MLSRISIQNIALISKGDIKFNSGLNVISGETGAGKSILIQAVSALLGDPVDQTALKSGATFALVEGLFKLKKKQLATIVPGKSRIELNPDNTLTIRREIKARGRGRFFINDQLVTKDEFKQLGTQLLEINSQHSHQKLMKPKNHLMFFDRALNLDKELKKIKHSFETLCSVTTEYNRIQKRWLDLKERRKLIEYQIQEIDGADLKPSEKNELIQQREKLRFIDEIKQSLTESMRICSEDEISLSTLSGFLLKSMTRIVNRDPALKSVYDQAESLAVIIEDLATELRKQYHLTEYSPMKLEELSERIHFLQDLEGKYQNDIQGIIKYRTKIEGEIHDLGDLSDQVDTLETKWKDAYKNYSDLDRKLSDLRRSLVPKLCRKIEKELSYLGMKGTRFEIEFSDQWTAQEIEPGTIPEKCTPNGSDTVQFLISANPGVPLKPLTKIASGGELSRILLALKQYFKGDSIYPTIIFDEVDSGIGGKVANSVAIQLRKLAVHRQLICVTHLSQIAVRSDSHILVEKHMGKAETEVELRILKESDRIQEIARMLSGQPREAEALTHARAMYDAAKKELNP